MSTTTEPKPPAAPPVKKTVPKEVIERLSRGDDGAPPAPAAAPKPGDGKPPVEPPKPGAGAPPVEPPKPGDATPPVEPPKPKKKESLPAIPAVTAPPAPDLRAVVQEVLDAGKAPPVTVTLRPEDQEEVELAEFAASSQKDKYVALPGQLKEWFSKRDQFLATKAKELGGESSPEFRDFLQSEECRTFTRQNAPGYQRGDKKKIYEDMLTQRGAEKARKELAPQLDDIQRKQLAMQHEPVIQRTVAQGLVLLLTDSAEKKDEALVDFAKDPAKFIEGNEIEGGIILGETAFYQRAMEETLRITSGITDLSVPTTDPNVKATHAFIDGFVTKTEGELEVKYPNGVRQPDGKILVSGPQMARLRSARVANLGDYRTLTPHEIVGAIAVDGRERIKTKLAAERQRLERAGYKKSAAAAVPPVEPPKEPKSTSSPLATSSPAAGAGSSAAQKTEKWFEKYIKG